MGKSLNLKSAVAAACVAMLAGIASAQAAISSFDPALERALATAEVGYTAQSRSLLTKRGKKHHKAPTPAPMPAPVVEATAAAPPTPTPAPEAMPKPMPTDVVDSGVAGASEDCLSLYGLVGAEADLSILKAGIEATELAAAIEPKEAAFTILAPTDNAFLAIPREDIESLVTSREALTMLLSVHVIEGAVKASDLTDGMEVVTLAGVTLTVSLADGAVKFTAGEGGTYATVTEADLMSCAGVVHKIDDVLVPGVPTGEMPATEMPTPVVEPVPVVEAVPEVMPEMAPMPREMPMPMMPMAPAPGVAPGPGGAPQDCGSILDVLMDAGDLNGLVQAIDTAELTPVVADTEAMVTVLAPTDEAFNMIPEEELMALLAEPDALGQILGLHVLEGVYKAADFAEVTEVATMAGVMLTVSVSDGMVTFTAPAGGSSAYVSEADLMSCEGVVHKINSILVPGIDMTPDADVDGESTPTPTPTLPAPMPTPPTAMRTAPTPMPMPAPKPSPSPMPTPTVEAPADCPSILDLATEAGQFTTLIAALESAGLAQNVANPDAELTVLAPTDDAFAAIPAEDLQMLQDQPAALAYILDLHIIQGAVKAADLTDGQEVETVGGQPLTVSLGDGTVTFIGPNNGGSATVTTPDLMSCKGVIHVIDTVITPGIPDMPTPTTSTPAPTMPTMPAPMPEEPAPEPEEKPAPPPSEEPTPMPVETTPPVDPPSPPSTPSGTTGGSCSDPMVQDMIAATMAERSKAGKGSQTCNEAGSKACMEWSMKQCQAGSLSHDLDTNMKAAGWGTAAENVLYNHGMDETVDTGIKQWMESSGHNENIMRDFDEIACGWATCGGSEVYWTCIYGQ